MSEPEFVQPARPLLPTSYSLLPTPYSLLLLLFLCLFAVGPLLQPGYFWGAHDAKNSVYFLFEFDKSIQDGILWPRWGPDWGFGYGYPFWNIYSPLAYYVAEAIHLAGFDFVAAVKITFGLSVLGSAAAMYLFVRRLWGDSAGLVAALVYVYVPYHLFDVYVRAALAESVSFVFVPLVFWGVYELIERPRMNAVVGAALAYAGLILSSNVLLLLVTPVACLLVVALVLGRWREVRHAGAGDRRALPALGHLGLMVIPPASAFVLSMGVLAVFLLPALLERGYVRLDQWFGGRYAFGHDFVYFFQLFSPRWGFGASIPGADDRTGFQLGVVPVVLLVMSFMVGVRHMEPAARRMLRFWQVMTLLAAFMMTPAAEPVWQALPVLQGVQFPWRLGVLTATGLAVAAGALAAAPVDRFDPNPEVGTVVSRGLSTVMLAAVIILGSYPYLHAEVRDPQPDEGPVSLAALFRYQQSSDEMTGTTAWARRIPSWSALAEGVVEGGGIDTRVDYSAVPAGRQLAVHSVERDSVHELVWVYAADDRQTVTFMIPYYPGWIATVHTDLREPAHDLKARVGPAVGAPPIHTTEEEGWLVVPVPSGEHFLEVRFVDTPVRVVGKLISMASLFGIVASVIFRRVRSRSRVSPPGTTR